MTVVESVNGKTGEVVLTASNVEAVPTSEVGKPNGVAELNSEGKLVEGELPSSVVTSSANGFPPSVIWLDTTPEYYGAKGDGKTDDTAAFQLCSEAIVAAGGGVMRLSAKTYIVDGYVWSDGVFHEGRSTTLKARAGSTNQAQITMAEGVIKSGGWKHIYFEPNGNEGQECFYLYARSAAENGGLWNAIFEDLVIGTGSNAWSGNGMWFRGGLDGNHPHQDNQFHGVKITRANTGPTATTNRCLKLTGQCNKFEFDDTCALNGGVASEHVGTNMEISREFLFATTLTAEAAAGATTLHVASATELKVGQTVSLGEGAFNETAEIKEITGTEVVLKAELGWTHPALTRLYTLSKGRSPALIRWGTGSIQNADLGVLVDNSIGIMFEGTDFENMSRLGRVRDETVVCFDNVHSVNAASEGESNGTGEGTVGSNIITNTTGAWAEGNVIYGIGIPPGATVTKVEGATITLSANVTANGTEGSQTMFLIKGGNGGGYVARFESASCGTVSWIQAAGMADNGIINAGASGVRVVGRERPGARQVAQWTTGVTLAYGAKANLDIWSAREIVVTSAAETIKTLTGWQITGEQVTIRAAVNGVRLENGGNIHIPQGSVTLAAGECAVLLCTDYGSSTWTLVSPTAVSNGVLERGEGTLVAGKATIKAAAATVTSLIVVTVLSGTVIGVGVKERKTGEFLVEATATSTDKFAWAILA